jgi:DNA-binding NarL/FixJ family response regulator
MEYIIRMCFSEVDVSVLFASADDVAGLLKRDSYDLLIIDLADEKKIQVIDKIILDYQATPILVYSNLSEIVFGVGLLKSVAKGYISKSSSEFELCAALDHVMANRTYMSPVLFERFFDVLNRSWSSDNPRNLLTIRELTIAELLTR